MRIDALHRDEAPAGRHEVLGIEVIDPRDVELPPVGDVILQRLIDDLTDDEDDAFAAALDA